MAVKSASRQELDKRRVAMTSVLAAVALTGLKLFIGLATGSLGILAEAAHSALDMTAALVTYLAVFISGKPADHEHLYGHGKVENLSALFETLLLLVTCIWIIHEAIDRLFVKTVEVEASAAAFAVMIVSIVVDVNRSRMLARAARDHNSQALEADALHFRTDIYSSLVVLLGLVLVKTGEWFPQLTQLQKADALAALGVALIVIYISMALAKRTVAALLDAAPAGLLEQVTALIRRQEGVIDCHKVRIRHSGPKLFIDAHVLVDGNQSLHAAHDLTEVIESAIRSQLSNADVTVHAEPFSSAEKQQTQTLT
ncbi:cation transporter [bacterium]|nr:cation transporter [bacterium]